MRMVARVTFALVVVFVAFPAFAAENTKPWTIMVYMVADNDLEDYALANLGQLIASGASPAANIVILADRAGTNTNGVGGLPGWKGAQLLSVGTGALKRLADWGNTDMGTAATVTRFIQTAARTFPADRYALFFWDHGGAWNGFGDDQTHGSTLTLDKLSKGVSDGLAAAGISRLGLVGFDACLMANFETMARMQKLAAYYLASEELEPGHGWDYGSLALLAKKPAATPVDIGTAMIGGFMAAATREKTVAQATLSLVDLGAFGALEKAVTDFSGAARGSMSTLASDLGREAGTTLAFGRAGRPEQDSNLVDLGALAASVAASSPGLATRCAAIQKALAGAVVASSAGQLERGSSGISIYFPNREKLYDHSYDTAGHDAWRQLLRSYFTSGASTTVAQRTPTFKATDNKGSMSQDKDGMTLSGTLVKGTSASIVDAWIAYGVEEDDKTVLLGDSPLDIDENRDSLGGFWDGTVLTLTQGKLDTYGYISVSDSDNGTSLYSIPMAYFDNGVITEDTYQDASLDSVVYADGNIISSTLYRESDDGIRGELVPRPGSKLVPLIEVVDEKGESTMEMVEDWGFDAARWRTIEIDFEKIDPGTNVYLELNAYNANDEGDWLYDEGVFKTRK